VVRTGNTGQSGIIDARGRICETAPLDTETYTVATVSLTSQKTLYTHIGDIVPYLSLATLILIPLLHHMKESNKKKG